MTILVLFYRENKFQENPKTSQLFKSAKISGNVGSG